ncbi:MAG TPA: decarboxylating 6-phosphogluconate dehydrogenase [Burkholderiales bacterium]|nr:decarboxylating 6-phosphogluconate dehydrogenase [Burkholderiales bacterium]
MKIGLVGLGRMGANMARRLARGGVEVVAQDVSPVARTALAAELEVSVVDTLPALVGTLTAPRLVWLMVPSGDATETALEALYPRLEPGDLVVDGGNAFYRDSITRARSLADRSIAFVDAGVSGGTWGLAKGYMLMLGGTHEAVARVAPLARVLAPAPDRGWLHCGPIGSGHFVKMVHNAIEYGMMQAYAEGFALLEAKEEFGLDVAAVAEQWRHGSVIRSWLLDLTAEALAAKPDMRSIAPVVRDSGEGRWAAREAIELGVPAPVTQLALAMRLATQGANDYPARLLALMRNAFGGHAIESKKQ